MLFNSLIFLVFFAIVLTLHNLPLPWRLNKFNLLIASYLFYAAWNPPFVVLIVRSTVADWYVAKHMHRATHQGRRRFLLVLSLSTNLGLLGYFKYGGFVLDNFVALVERMGVSYAPPEWSIASALTAPGARSEFSRV